MIKLAVAACPHTPGQEMSPAAATTGSEPVDGGGVLVGPVRVGETVGVGATVGVGEAVRVGEGVGVGVRVVVAVGLGVPVVAEGVGVGLTQCGLCGFGRWQGAPWTGEEPTDTPAATASTTSVPPMASRMILFRRRCLPLPGMETDMEAPSVRRRG